MAELLLWLFAEFFGDLILHSIATPRALGVSVRLIGYAAFGAAMAGLSLLVLPDHLIASGDLRVWNLLVTPILAAAVMAAVGAYRRRRDKRVVGMEKFVYAYVCALSFGFVRYYFAG